ncbi:MAG: multicopper oxidase domain-containing protein, partial [Actinomycetota bacterium]|nr:multicopper oxidase domain-containing protein [Actinomycetota bacterium]
MLALLLPGRAEARTIEYWVAAVPVTWNVVPNGRDPISGAVFSRDETTFRTIVYKKFTRGWRRPLPNRGDVAGDNDGIPGPTIRARVGDTVLIHFKNRDRLFNRPHSMHFHGFHYPFSSDGAYIPGTTGRGANVKPGQTFT